MYCDMERSCKGVGGGWMRVASINMTDTSHQCPSGLRTLNTPRRLCSMNMDNGGCSSAVFPVEGVQYSRVCGKIIGYQQKTPDCVVTRIGLMKMSQWRQYSSMCSNLNIKFTLTVLRILYRESGCNSISVHVPF